MWTHKVLIGWWEWFCTLFTDNYSLNFGEVENVIILWIFDEVENVVIAMNVIGCFEPKWRQYTKDFPEKYIFVPQSDFKPKQAGAELCQAQHLLC